MNLPLSAANACQNEAPLFRVQAKSDFSTYKNLCWAVTGSHLMLSGGFLGLLALILVLASLTPSSEGFAFWLGAALLFPFLLWLTGTLSRADVRWLRKTLFPGKKSVDIGKKTIYN